MAISRHEVLTKTGKYVDSMISMLSRDVDPEEICTKAFEDLGRLVKESRTLIAGDEVPSMFADGIQSVINRLDAFRTGFARTYEQENGGVSKSDAWAEWKSPLALKPIIKEMTPTEFVAFVQKTVTVAQKCAEYGFVGKALESLRLLKADIKKAESFEDTTAGSITVTVENDPMRIIWTETSGTTAPAGTSRPDTAASNYVTNPGDVTAGPPETGKNPGTASLAEAKSNAPASDSNFVAAGGGNGIAKTEDVVKAADEALTKSLESLGVAIEKSNPERHFSASGWAQDLSTPEFLHGKTRERF